MDFIDLYHDPDLDMEKINQAQISESEKTDLIIKLMYNTLTEVEDSKKRKADESEHTDDNEEEVKNDGTPISEEKKDILDTDEYKEFDSKRKEFLNDNGKTEDSKADHPHATFDFADFHDDEDDTDEDE